MLLIRIKMLLRKEAALPSADDVYRGQADMARQRVHRPCVVSGREKRKMRSLMKYRALLCATAHPRC